jgi:hypothetical protein
VRLIRHTLSSEDIAGTSAEVDRAAGNSKEMATSGVPEDSRGDQATMRRSVTDCASDDTHSFHGLDTMALARRA